MENKYSKCQKCPAFHLLSEERKDKIEMWEYKRDKYIARMTSVKLILLGECIEADRYFYDINTLYPYDGLRYTLKIEFGKVEISDSLFLESMARKGIVLFDCALCPLYLIENNALRRKAATHCFITINRFNLNEHPGIPIATVFPAGQGYIKKEIPAEILSRVKGEFSDADQAGLSELFLSR